MITGARLHRLLLTAVCLLLLSGFVSATARAADPSGSLSESILSNQASGPYEIGVAGAVFADDSALAVDVEEVDGGGPPPEGTTVSFLLAPETDPAKQSEFGSGAAATEFTPDQERDTIAAVPESPGVWVLNPAPLNQDGPWKGRLLVDGPAGAESVGFSFNVHPVRPAWSPLLILSQPLIPFVALGLALSVVLVLRKPLLQSRPVAESPPVAATVPRTPAGG